SVSLSGLNAVTFPRRASSTVAPGDTPWVAEGAVIPAAQLAMETVTLGPQRKLARVIAMTRELAEIGGEPVLSAMLKEDVSVALDKLIFSATAAVAGVSPAGLLAGLTPEDASTATNLGEAMIVDLETLGAAVCDLGSSGAGLLYVATPRQALSANLR